MTDTWEVELRKLKRRYNEETLKNAKELRMGDSYKSEFRKLMKLLKALLSPVVEVFREEELTRTLQPHIHEYKNGYTLVSPVAKPGSSPIILKIEFELVFTQEGYILKINKETPEKMHSPEIIIESPITEERIQNEIRTFLNERQSIVLNIRKKKTKFH